MEAKKYATYEDILKAPDHVIAEIIDGNLTMMPRPSPRHARAQSSLGIELGGPFDKGSNGPGGWVFLDEPELWLLPESGSNGNYMVPDIAGWRKERFIPDDSKNGIDIAPDWLCEILSPSTARHDRIIKMPKYAEFKIPYVWLIDPLAKTLEVFILKNEVWTMGMGFSNSDIVKAPPFEQHAFNLSYLWL